MSNLDKDYIGKISVEQLKKDAKKLAKAEGLSHSKALDKIAQNHGYENWKFALNYKYNPEQARRFLAQNNSVIIQHVESGDYDYSRFSNIEAAWLNERHQDWVKEFDPKHSKHDNAESEFKSSLKVYTLEEMMIAHLYGAVWPTELNLIQQFPSFKIQTGDWIGENLKATGWNGWFPDCNDDDLFYASTPSHAQELLDKLSKAAGSFDHPRYSDLGPKAIEVMRSYAVVDSEAFDQTTLKGQQSHENFNSAFKALRKRATNNKNASPPSLSITVYEDGRLVETIKASDICNTCSCRFDTGDVQRQSHKNRGFLSTINKKGHVMLECCEGCAQEALDASSY